MKKNNNYIRIIGSTLNNNKAILIALLLSIVFAVMSPVFLTNTNLLNLLRQVCVSGIVALGFTLILGLGSIDLSVGSEVGLVGALIGLLMTKYSVGIVPAIIIGLVVGIILGLVNALMITSVEVPPFIATLATQAIFRGIIYIMTDMVAITGIPTSFINIGQGYFLGIPIPVYIFAVMSVIVFILIKYTGFGRKAMAMGDNPQAAFAAGVNVIRIRIISFMIMGLFAAIAAIVLTSRTASAQVGAGLNMEMDVIAAVVIGGTPMSGGKANVIGTIFGCLIIGIVNNGLTLIGVDPNWQMSIKGLLIFIAVVMDIGSERLMLRTVKGKNR